MQDQSLFFPILVVIVVVIVMAYFGERRRRKALKEAAQVLGLRFSPNTDHHLPKALSFLNVFRQGHSQYGNNVIDGLYRDCPVTALDFHYTTGSGKNKQNHCMAVFLLKLDHSYPELRIYPENLLSRIGQAIGFEDIDFESVEFSRAFTVRAKDKKFAYDICHTRMMEHLLTRPCISLEMERNYLVTWEKQKLQPQRLQHCLDELVTLRNLFPTYLEEV